MKTLKEKKNPYRLDRNLEPLVYDITLQPDLEKFTFRGAESIIFKAQKAYTKITLHAVELVVHKAFLCGGSLEDTLLAVKISYDAKLETVTLDFGRSLKPDEADCLCLEFDGILNDTMHGFYRTSYEVDGQKRWGATTQFEATDARRAFPCWDEPDMKARFKIELIVPAALTALSNMPVEKQSKLAGGLKQVSYELSPIMSTYLVAFIVADLEYVEGKDKNGILIRIYTMPGKIEQGRFALKVAQHALPYFGDWFGIPYALPKCDMVALPDFASGAMENWGLITYRETALLVDAKNSSASARQRVAEVIDHELAHQWFGNLVTMSWWTDLWLNEGFASYMGPKAVHDQFPEWEIWDQFIVADYLRALSGDALKNTHAIEIPVQHPSEIREIFDAITYSKGSSVNRMLEHYLGENIFRKGLRVYLKKFAWGNATTKDLWDVLEKVSGKPVRAIMTSYTDQPGFPVLTVRNKKGKPAAFEVKQERFLFDGSKDRQKTLWNVPLVVARSETKKNWVGLLKSSSTTVELGKKSAWVKINAGQSGFYRVAYPAEMLEGLAEALRSRSLPYPVIDALGILSDSLALARAGYFQTSKVLDLLDAVKNEREYNIWTLIAGGLQSVDGLLKDPSARETLAEFALSLILPALRDLGWDKKKSDTHSDLLLRSLLIFQAGHYGSTEVIQEARSRFEKFLKTAELEPNLRGSIYSLMAENGDTRIFQQLVKIYRASALQEEKVRILRAMARFRDKAVIPEVLKFALSKDVRSQDTYVILASFGSNAAGRHLAWKFNKGQFKELFKRYEGGSVSLLGHILEGSVTGFNTAEDLADVKAFFTKHPVQGIERTMKQALEIIQSNIRWTAKSRKDVESWLLK